MFNTAESAKHFLLRKAVVPAFLKVRELKHDGVSGTDLLKACGFVAGLYGVKNLAHYFSVGRAIRGDFAGMRYAVLRCRDAVAHHSIKFSAAALALFVAFGCFKLWSVLKKHANVELVDQFLLTFSTDQRKKIMVSPELVGVMDQVNTDPSLD